MVQHLLDRRSAIECLVRSLKIVVVGEGSEPALRAAVLGVVEALDSHFQRVEPLFDQISIDEVEVAAQIGAS